MDPHLVATPAQAAGSTPISGLVVLNPGVDGEQLWSRQLWPAAYAVTALRDFTAGRHLVMGAGEVGEVHEPSGSPDDRLVTLITGRIAAAFIDLRAAEGTPLPFLTDLDPGSSMLVPAGVAFGFQVLTPPAGLSIVHSGGVEISSTTASLDSAPRIAWPLPRPEPGPMAQRLDFSTKPFRVLFVCTANICRSAYADAAANARPHQGIEFVSAGVHALVGHPIDPPMAACLPASVDATAHRGHQLTRDDMVDAGLVLTMAGEHRRYILEEWPDLARKTFVLGHVAREIQQAPDDVTLLNLTDYLWRRRTTDRHDDVADPYRRGPEAAAAAARKIDAFLDALIKGITQIARASDPGPGRSPQS